MDDFAANADRKENPTTEIRLVTILSRTAEALALNKRALSVTLADANVLRRSCGSVEPTAGRSSPTGNGAMPRVLALLPRDLTTGTCWSSID